LLETTNLLQDFMKLHLIPKCNRHKLQRVPFIAAPSTAALCHRKPTSAGTAAVGMGTVNGTYYSYTFTVSYCGQMLPHKQRPRFPYFKKKKNQWNAKQQGCKL